MNFERGKDTKKALDIGLLNKLKKCVEEIERKYAFRLCDSIPKRAAVAELESMMGMPVDVKILVNDGGLYFIEAECPLIKPSKVIRIQIQNGLQYSEDYQEVMTNRSLVTKSYVEDGFRENK